MPEATRMFGAIVFTDNDIASRIKDPKNRSDYFYKNYYNRQIISELEKLWIS